MMMYYLFIAISKMIQGKYDAANFFYITLVTYTQESPGCRFISEAMAPTAILPCYLGSLKYGKLVGLILLSVWTLATRTPQI